MKLKIRITQEVLRKSMLCGVNGLSLPGTDCAIAIAVRDIFPNASVRSRSICGQVHEGEDKNSGFNLILPEEAFNFIKSFDLLLKNPSLRLLLPEFSFEIDVPQELIDEIGIDDINTAISNSLTLEQV